LEDQDKHMKTKQITFELPPFITIGQYQKMNSYKGDSALHKLVTLVEAITKYPKEDILTWDMKSLQAVSDKFKEVADPDNEFHSLIEWNGELHGYAHMDKANLGEYIDLENLSKDLENNLHKVAALMYRPVTKHRFNTLKYGYKQKVKMVKNDVANVFDYYEIETYDNQTRKDREESFKDFPVHIILGAVAFFLATANLYLTTTLSSADRINKKDTKNQMTTILESLSQSIGLGGGLSTTSLNPTYLQLQETKP
jgi:hypothetical protein